LGTEPFSNTEAPDNFFDVHSLTKKSLNNRNFAMILREIILKYREKKNKDLNRKYLDFPENTLVYIKDQSKREKRKSKPLYLKCPAKIIKQYRCTVYALNILGRVSKHSKDNIKKAGDRSIRLFGKLPDKLKLVLGSPAGRKSLDSLPRNKYGTKIFEQILNLILKMV
jgi:restriction endonuclease